MDFSTSCAHLKGMWFWKFCGRIWGYRIIESQWCLDVIFISLYTIFSCQKRGNYNFHISYSIFTLLVRSAIAICSCSTDHQRANSIYTINIFSEFICLLQSFIRYVSKISRHEEFWNKAWQFVRWRLKLLPQMSHKDSAPMLFLPLCICECPQCVTTYKDEMTGPLLIPLLAITCIISYFRL